MDFVSLINFYFQVKTQDGYILNMQRIPEGRIGGNSSGNKKQPVLIQHGVLVVSPFFFSSFLFTILDECFT